MTNIHISDFESEGIDVEALSAVSDDDLKTLGVNQIGHHAKVSVVAKCCSVVAVCCSVVQCVAVCCSVLQCVAVLLQCVAVCCSALQCAAVCCSVLQCVAVEGGSFITLHMIKKSSTKI